MKMTPARLVRYFTPGLFFIARKGIEGMASGDERSLQFGWRLKLCLRKDQRRSMAR